MDKVKGRKSKNIAMIILIFIGLFLLTCTNNNPNAIIQRILRPIHIGNGTLYYAGIIPILIIYYSLKEIYKENDFTLLNARFKRIVIIILLLIILPSFSQEASKLYKRFSSGLNSIYCHRENMGISASTQGYSTEVICKLDLENCSSSTKEFYVKVRLPSHLEDIKESIFNDNNTLLVLNPKERKKFEVRYVGRRERSGNNRSVAYLGLSNYEFSLYNSFEEVEFTTKD